MSRPYGDLFQQLKEEKWWAWGKYLYQSFHLWEKWKINKENY
jgi:hypothetical protein